MSLSVCRRIVCCLDSINLNNPQSDKYRFGETYSKSRILSFFIGKITSRFESSYKAFPVVGSKIADSLSIHFNILREFEVVLGRKTVFIFLLLSSGKGDFSFNFSPKAQLDYQKF